MQSGMAIALLENMRPTQDDKSDRNVPIRIGSGTDELYSQDLFRDLLIHERKRSERSNHQLFFVALDIKDVLTSTRADAEVVGKIIKSLSKASREIDIKGWYENPICIGIIYTELEVQAYERILDKLRMALTVAVGSEIVERIGITYTTFPELDGKKWTRDRSEERVLFPPLPPKTILKESQVWLKDFLDLVASIIGVALLSPLLIVVALLIKATSRGPVVFKQERIGRGGKKFQLYKFRSMKVNNDSGIHQDFVKKLISGETPAGVNCESPSYKIKHDPRVTAIGRFIRATSIDELPQLFNVLLGNMSLVGPRPPLAYEVEVYQAWHRSRVVSVKPGITGLWQVNGRSKTTFDGMVRMDLEYIRTWSFWLDMKLLFKTPAVVVTTKGAY